LDKRLLSCLENLAAIHDDSKRI